MGTKDCWLKVRVSAEELEKYCYNAELSNMSLSKWVRECLCPQSKEVVVRNMAKPVEIKEEKPFVPTNEVSKNTGFIPVDPTSRKHALNCRCFTCKPPKDK